MYIADGGLLHLAAAKSAKTKEYLFHTLLQMRYLCFWAFR